MRILNGLSKHTSIELYECRKCGEKFSREVDECPNCHWRGIAHYVF